MKRNWDLIRDVLVRIEDEASSTNRLRASDFSSEQHEVIAFHLELLISAELIHGTVDCPMSGEIDVLNIKGLTWDGHEFLDKIRSESVWAQTKERFKSEGLSMTIDAVKKVAGGIATDLLG